MATKPDEWGEEVARFNSRRRPENIYIVRRFLGGKTRGIAARIGEYGCNCPGWRFSKNTPRDCLHVRRVIEGDLDNDDVILADRRAMAVIDAMGACGYFTGTTTATVVQMLRATRAQDGRPAVPMNSAEQARRHVVNVRTIVKALDRGGFFSIPEPSRERSIVIGRGARLITLED